MNLVKNNIKLKWNCENVPGIKDLPAVSGEAGTGAGGAPVSRRQSKNASLLRLVTQDALFFWSAFVSTCAVSQQPEKQTELFCFTFRSSHSLNCLGLEDVPHISRIFWWQLIPFCGPARDRKQVYFPVCDKLSFCCLSLLLPKQSGEAGFPACELIYAMCLKSGNYSCLSSLPDFHFPGIWLHRNKLLLFLVKFPS